MRRRLILHVAYSPAYLLFICFWIDFSMGVSDDLKYVCCHRLYACINTQKLKGLDSKEITSLPEIKKVIYMASYFNHRRKWTVCSSQDPFAYNESLLRSCNDSYSEFPWSSLGTLGTMTPFCLLNTKINALQILEASLLMQTRLLMYML